VGQPNKGRFLDRPTPWVDPPAPGPTVVIDIDGPLANMDEFAHLIQAPKYKDRDWKAFHSHFGDAALNRAGGRLVRDLVDAGFTIAYTTTRLDTFMQTTDYWIRQKSLPPGHIECRDFWTDGTVRPSLDIKRRHWWKWVDKYEDQSPVVAWIDDGPEAVAMLAEQGCPVWKFDQLVVEHLADNLLSVIERGPRPADELAKQRAEARPIFDEAEAEHQRKHKKWQQAHVARMKQRHKERRQRRAQS